MNFGLVSFTSGLIQKQAVSEIIRCNEYTDQFGLSLTQEQALELVETRAYALNSNGRIEFGGGVIDKIIKEFCDSPYLYRQNYAHTLNDLTEIFYYYKNETMDMMTDDDLIKFMKTAFDGICQGSLELLAGRELYVMASNLRSGRPTEMAQRQMPDSEEDEDEQ
ncbi:MAG: hypothetical protein GX096_08210 [Clostridiales bacterium]|nr:hypothetical protein [Clostridiales bacterium]